MEGEKRIGWEGQGEVEEGEMGEGGREWKWECHSVKCRTSQPEGLSQTFQWKVRVVGSGL